MQLYYRLHSSILKLLERTDDEIDYDLFESHLDKVAETPFHVTSVSKGLEKTTCKEEGVAGRKILYLNHFLTVYAKMHMMHQ